LTAAYACYYCARSYAACIAAIACCFLISFSVFI
jgi:hypothetical protein